MCDCDPEFYDTWIVKKTRKPHECYECGQIIQAGNSMNKTSGKWEGEIENFYTCIPCQEKADVWQEQNPDECFHHGMLYILLSQSESGESDESDEPEAA